MRIWIGLYIVVALGMWPLLAGWTFSYFQCKWPRLADEHRWGDALMSILLMLLAAAEWPIGLPLVYVLSEKAKHGWWGRP